MRLLENDDVPVQAIKRPDEKIQCSFWIKGNWSLWWPGKMTGQPDQNRVPENSNVTLAVLAETANTLQKRSVALDCHYWRHGRDKMKVWCKCRTRGEWMGV